MSNFRSYHSYANIYFEEILFKTFIKFLLEIFLSALFSFRSVFKIKEIQIWFVREVSIYYFSLVIVTNIIYFLCFSNKYTTTCYREKDQLFITGKQIW